MKAPRCLRRTVLVLGGLAVAWPAAAAYNVRPAYDHPRLYFWAAEIGNTTTAQNLLAARNAAASNPIGDRYFRDLRSLVNADLAMALPADGYFDRWRVPRFMAGCAMVYLMQKDYAVSNSANAYADKAAEWFKHFLWLVDHDGDGSLWDEAASVREGWDTSYRSPTGLQETLAALIKVYDWLYTYAPASGNYLTAADKQRFRMLLKEQMDRLNSPPLNVNWMRRFAACVLAGVALDGENAGPEGDTTNLLDSAAWIGPALTYCDAVVPPDPQVQEYFYVHGPDYGDLDTNQLAEIAYLGQKHGFTDLASRRSFSSVKQYYLSLLVDTDDEESYEFPIFDEGLLNGFIVNMCDPVYSRPAGVYASVLMKFAFVLGDGQVQTLLNDVVWEPARHLDWGANFAETLWMNAPVAPVPLTSDQLFHFYADANVWFAKSGWTAADTHLMFRCGPPTSIHHDMDANGFLLYAGGDWSAIEEAVYNGTLDLQGNTLNKSTRPHCTLLVDDQGQVNSDLYDYYPLGVIPATPSLQTLKIDHVLDRPGFSYGVGHGAGAYVLAGHVLERFDRHLLFIKPDLVVVADDLQDNTPRHWTWMLNVTPRGLITYDGSGLTRIGRNTERATAYTRTSETDIHHVWPPASELSAAVSDVVLSATYPQYPGYHLDLRTTQASASQTLLNLLHPRPAASASWQVNTLTGTGYVGAEVPERGLTLLAARQTGVYERTPVRTDAKLAWLRTSGGEAAECFAGVATELTLPRISWHGSRPATLHLDLQSGQGVVRLEEHATLTWSDPLLLAVTTGTEMHAVAGGQVAFDLDPGTHSLALTWAHPPASPRNLRRR